MMSDAQLRMYRAEWSKARKALRALGQSPAAADARRKEIHAAVGAIYGAHHPERGEPKSSLDLTNAELDLVLGKFRALSQPANLQAQLRQIEQPATRAHHVVGGLLSRLGIQADLREKYLDGVCQRACRTYLIDMKDEQWPIAIAALRRTVEYKEANPF